LFDVVIIGSGAAGVGAALGASGTSVLMLDPGHAPDQPEKLPTAERLRAMRDTSVDLFPQLVGENFEGMALVDGRETISPKLKSPRMRFITRDWHEISPVKASGFDAQMSFATGGLANGWGAGLYRFSDTDLAGFPIGAADLKDCYDRLTREIGINGQEDDLTGFFGDYSDLQAPLELNRGAKLFLDSYSRRRQKVRRGGFSVGRPRQAVLSEAKDGRPPYDYRNWEFFTPNDTSIYTPALTVRKLVAERRIEYRRSLLATRFEEDESGVTVRVRNLATGELEAIRSKSLIVTAGCLNTAKIVLASGPKDPRKLPLLENLVSYVPLVNPRLIGAPESERCFGMGQLIVVYSGPLASEPIQGTVYDLSAPLRSDLIFDFPLAFRGNLAASRYLTPAMLLVQFFYPDEARPENWVMLNSDGSLGINYESREFGRIEAQAIRAFRGSGWLGHPSLCKYLRAGNSYHYAGCLPMKRDPGPFETDVSGRLFGHRRVFVGDSACFSRLPSKNLTFTSMANAMRIARGAAETLA
jgi:choline dehydrogenase-like flavoprotein